VKTPEIKAEAITGEFPAQVKTAAVAAAKKVAAAMVDVHRTLNLVKANMMMSMSQYFMG